MNARKKVKHSLPRFGAMVFLAIEKAVWGTWNVLDLTGADESSVSPEEQVYGVKILSVWAADIVLRVPV
jgi:hypothetical protein